MAADAIQLLFFLFIKIRNFDYCSCFIERSPFPYLLAFFEIPERIIDPSFRNHSQ